MTNLRHLTSLQIKVILVLMDCRGHPLWELAEILDVKKNNLLTNAMYPLLAMKIIEKAPPRPTTRPDSQHPNKKEIPYVLSTKTNVLASAFWCLNARMDKLSAEQSRIYATTEASGFIATSWAKRLNEINQEITQIGKQTKALYVLMGNLKVLLMDKKDYSNLMERLRLSNLSKKEFQEIFESLELNA